MINYLTILRQVLFLTYKLSDNQQLEIEMCEEDENYEPYVDTCVKCLSDQIMMS